MSKFMKTYCGENIPTEPVDEGIGVAISKASPSVWSLIILDLVTPLAISWQFLLVYWLSRSMYQTAIGIFSKRKAIEMLSDIHMHEYIEKQCHELYIKAKKTYPTLKEFTSDVHYTFDLQLATAKGAAGVIKSATNCIFLNKVIKSVSYKHTVVVFCDTTHIDKVYAIFSHPESKTYVCAPIPTPRKEDLKRFFND